MSTNVTAPAATTAPMVNNRGEEFHLLPEWSGNTAAERLHEWLTVSHGNVFTVLEHVSKSGMTRDIVVHIPTGDVRFPMKWASGPVANVLGWSIRKNKSGIRVQGCGMDMGFHLVYSLSAALYGEGYALDHHWL